MGPLSPHSKVHCPRDTALPECYCVVELGIEALLLLLKALDREHS